MIYGKTLLFSASVATARAVLFANFWNKIGKILKIFNKLDLPNTILKLIEFLRNHWLDLLELANDPSVFGEI